MTADKDMPLPMGTGYPAQRTVIHISIAVPLFSKLRRVGSVERGEKCATKGTISGSVFFGVLRHENAIDIAVEYWACVRGGSAGCGGVCEHDDWAGVEVGGRFWVQGGRRRGDVGLHAWKRRTAGRGGDRVERDTGPPVLPRAACG